MIKSFISEEFSLPYVGIVYVHFNDFWQRLEKIEYQKVIFFSVYLYTSIIPQTDFWPYFHLLDFIYTHTHTHTHTSQIILLFW